MTTLEVDLSSPPTPAPPPRWRVRLPWILFGVTLLAFALSLAPRTLPPEPTPAPAPPPEVTIDYESNGYSEGPHVRRDESGAITSVVLVVEPWDAEAVMCRLVVDGAEVVDEGDGHAAICVWAG